jgi:hypothetical protein
MATYPPPNQQQGSIFNPSDWIEGNNSNLDIQYLNEHYCKFPVAQGNMSFAGISNTGTTTIGQNLVMTGTPNVNYLEFADGTKQYTAVAGDDILDTANVFTKNNTFPSISFNTGTGANLTSSNGGLVSDSNINTPSLFIDDGNNDSYSVRSENGFGFILANIDGDGSLTISNNATTFSTLSVSTTGMSCSTDFSAPSISCSSINETSDNTDITITGSGVNSGIVLDSTAGVSIEGNQVLSFPSNGQISADANGLTSTVDLYVKTQPVYSSSTVYGDKASTQAFVQSAISGQGSGDASLSANQTFTGINTFSNYVNFSAIVNQSSQFSIGNKLRLTLDTGPTFVQSYYELNSDGTTTYSNIINLPSQTYSGSVAYGNVASTQQFVIQAIASQGGGDAYLNGTQTFTGVNTFNGATNFNSNVAFNTNIPTTSVSQTFPSSSTNSFATVGYVNSLSTKVNSTFTPILGVYSMVSNVNYMTSYIVGNTVFFNGAISFFSQDNASKFTFSFSPALPNTTIGSFQSATLY